MTGKILKVALCFALVLGLSSLTFAAGKADSSDVSYKDKIGLAFSIPGGIASGRLWIANTLAIDLIAGLSVGGGSDFGFTLGSNIVFPLVEEKGFNVYLTPGLLVGLSTDSVSALPVIDESTMSLSFAFGAAIEAEAFIVKNLLSIGGSFGLKLGINVNSATDKVPNPDVTTSTTDFQMGVGSTTGAVMIRVYI